MFRFKKVINLADESMSSSENPRPQIKLNKKYIIAVFLLGIALMFVLNNLYIVPANEYKIVRQFGEIVRIIDKPGLNYKLPIVQTISTLPKYTLIYDVPPAEINTLDKKRIKVDYYGLWRITDPQALIESLRTLGGAEGRLGDIIYSNIRTELGKMDYEQIVNHKKSRRGDIDTIVKTQVNEILLSNNSGIELVDIKMKRTDLPIENEHSVFQRMISERVSTAQEYLSQGDAEALKIEAETDREVEEMLARAEAEAKIIVAEGEKEAARIYNEAYGKDPEFFNMFISLESYKTIIDEETVIIFPMSSPYLKYLLGQ
ncbi:protease modulator HflC [Alkaliphilus peptidifermentans]|uniref:Protein HflC n=1 Tax=Alkaliphilus peptidifermentans DSM 18978 TaxID=1120976 RepID=A0A1G5ASN8_9FIRM|nr:protease modulator HflC [Alkaliphilus peptidifermentans]SCX80859.1 membrane protease subunit HflC [Alkaliphilus peptidifermentans DSM 18978]